MMYIENNLVGDENFLFIKIEILQKIKFKIMWY